MTTEWYFLVWPWIGLGGAIVLSLLLLWTNDLRMDLNVSRWKDCSWLAWLATTAYLLHNVEEYGIDLFGHLHAFPSTMDDMLTTVGTGNLPPEIFFAAVNISMFWIASPLAARLGRTRPLFAVGMSGVLFVNALSHLLPFVMGGGYTPGTLTAAILFLPISLWTFYSCFGKGKLSYAALGMVVLIGMVSHGLLGLSILLYTKGVVTVPILVAMQVLNAGSSLFLWFLAERMEKRRCL